MILDEIRKSIINENIILLHEHKKQMLLKNDICSLHKDYQKQQILLEVMEKYE